MDYFVILGHGYSFPLQMIRLQKIPIQDRSNLSAFLYSSLTLISSSKYVYGLMLKSNFSFNSNMNPALTL